MDSFYTFEQAFSRGRLGFGDEFKILPLGLVHSQKGDFLVDDESFSLMKKEFQANGVELPVDYEHQTLAGSRAPAAGWIKDIMLKRDGIYGKVEWTPQGAAYLENKEYKYCSPVIMRRGTDGKAVKLHSVALTNKPAICNMAPIVNKEELSEEPDQPQEEDCEQDIGMMLERLTELLGLPNAASMKEICDAISKLQNEKKEMAFKEESWRFEARRQKADELVEIALKSGKVTPFLSDWAFNNAMQDTEGFISWLKNTNQIIPMGKEALNQFKEDIKRFDRPRMFSHTDELMGLSREDITKYGRNHDE